MSRCPGDISVPTKEENMPAFKFKGVDFIEFDSTPLNLKAGIFSSLVGTDISVPTKEENMPAFKFKGVESNSMKSTPLNLKAGIFSSLVGTDISPGQRDIHTGKQDPLRQTSKASRGKRRGQTGCQGEIHPALMSISCAMSLMGRPSLETTKSSKRARSRIASNIATRSTYCACNTPDSRVLTRSCILLTLAVSRQTA